MSATPATAMRYGLQNCGACGLLSLPAPGVEEGHCPRCAEPVAFRKRDSIQRTWAFVIAAAICSEVQVPMPVSLSGVMLRPANAPRPGISNATSDPPRYFDMSGLPKKKPGV